MMKHTISLCMQLIMLCSLSLQAAQEHIPKDSSTQDKNTQSAWAIKFLVGNSSHNKKQSEPWVDEVTSFSEEDCVAEHFKINKLKPSSTRIKPTCVIARYMLRNNKIAQDSSFSADPVVEKKLRNKFCYGIFYRTIHSIWIWK